MRTERCGRVAVHLVVLPLFAILLVHPRAVLTSPLPLHHHENRWHSPASSASSVPLSSVAAATENDAATPARFDLLCEGKPVTLSMDDHSTDFLHSDLHHLPLRVYTGSVVGAPDSHARLSARLVGGQLTKLGGFVRIDRDTFVVQSQGDHVVCIHEADIIFADGAETSCRHGQRARNVSSVTGVSPPRPVKVDERGSRQRRAPASPNHKFCEIFLDADARFLQAWGGDCPAQESDAACTARKEEETILRMIDILHAVDGIYADRTNFGGNTIRFRVRGAKAHSSSFGTPLGSTTQPVNPSDILDRYASWLGANSREQGYPQFGDVCLNHLFTHNNAGGTLGQATILTNRDGSYKSSICFAGTLSGRFGREAANVGFSTSVSQRGSSVPLWQTILVAAHEFGHNLGSQHDCCDSNNPDCDVLPSCDADPGSHQCWPSDAQGGRYIMFPSVTNDRDARNARVFSPCSKTFIQDGVQESGSCLKVPNACPTDGPCCDNGRPKPKGTLCRNADPFNPCEGPAYCTGDGPFCPANDPLPDGSPCDAAGAINQHGDLGVCHEGSCSHIHEGFCATSVPGSVGCTIPGNECVRACFTEQSSCLQYSTTCGIVDPQTNRIRAYTNDLNCPISPENTPCTTSNGKDGLCTSRGQCEECDKPGCDLDFPTQAPPVPICEWVLMEAADAPCSSTCGAGIRTTGYICECRDARRRDQGACTTPKPEPIVEQCNLQPCPQDCTCSEWSEWGVCSTTCDEGSSTRQRECTEAVAGGATCRELGLNDRETRSCNVALCEQGCQSEADCIIGACFTSPTCASGKCSAELAAEGAECLLSNTDAASSFGICTSGVCAPPPQDCAVSDWSSWQECNAQCLQSRERSIESPATIGGAECPALSEFRGCCGVAITFDRVLDSSEQIAFTQAIQVNVVTDATVAFLLVDLTNARRRADAALVSRAIVQSSSIDDEELLSDIKDNQNNLESAVSAEWEAVLAESLTSKSGGGGGTDGGAIAGAIFGTLIGIALVGGIIWYVRRGSASRSGFGSKPSTTTSGSSKVAGVTATSVGSHSGHSPSHAASISLNPLANDVSSPATMSHKPVPVRSAPKAPGLGPARPAPFHPARADPPPSNTRPLRPAGPARIATDRGSPSKPAATARPPSTTKAAANMYTATTSYSSNEEYHLQLNVGDRIEVIQKHNVDWWEGKCRGQEGYFPASAVRPASKKAPPAPPSRPSRPVSSRPSRVAHALYDYAARDAAELSFSAGDALTILEMETDTDGWYLAQTDAGTGLIPSNYVTMRRKTIDLGNDHVNNSTTDNKQSAAGRAVNEGAGRPVVPSKPSKPAAGRPVVPKKPSRPGSKPAGGQPRS